MRGQLSGQDPLGRIQVGLAILGIGELLVAAADQRVGAPAQHVTPGFGRQEPAAFDLGSVT